MIILNYQHDRAVDALTMEIYSGPSLHAELELSPVSGDRPNYWTASVDAPSRSMIYFKTFETVGEDEPKAATHGYERGFVDGATIEIGSTPSGFDAVIDAVISHGDLEWSGGSSGSSDAASIAQYLASYLAKSKRISLDGPALIGQQLKPDLVAGASYLATHGRALRFSNTSSMTPPAGTTAVLRAIGHSPAARQFSLTGILLERTDPTKIVQFEASSQQSAQWQPGTYQFQIDLVFPGTPQQTAPFLGPGSLLNVLQPVPFS